MSYCLNPHCSHPENTNDVKFCQTCGTKLFLKERYRAIKPIGQGGFGRTFLDDPGRGDAFYFDAVVVRIDEDILLLQTIHQGLLKAGTLPVVLGHIQGFCFWPGVFIEAKVRKIFS